MFCRLSPEKLPQKNTHYSRSKAVITRAAIKYIGSFVISIIFWLRENGEEKMSASEEEYEVDRIINDRVEKGEKQYLIRWKGFGA